MKDILGIPIIENAYLPKGTAFLIVKEKGVVTQMVEVYNEMKGMDTASLIAELESRRPDCTKCAPVGRNHDCAACVWIREIKDNFKEIKHD